MSVKTDNPCDDYKALIKSAIRDEEAFLRLTLSQKRGDDSTPWIKIGVRPILVKGRKGMQFSYFDAKKCITKNCADDAFYRQLDDALAIPFTRMHVQSTSGDIHVRITRKGKALIAKGKPSRQEQSPILAHNRVKQYPLDIDKPDPFLHAIGIMNKQGKVRAARQGKFRQINEFLRIVQRIVPESPSGSEPIRIVDCGCGNAYLTFAAYHYLHHVRGLPVHLVGLDVNEACINRCHELCESLGWTELEFQVSSIAEFTPDAPPEVVLSLHACDTATDEAIAQGIRWRSRVILAAPCCQHELQGQLQAPLFQPLLRHGILKERLGDLLTDTFRAQALRVMGYNTRVFQFVAQTHTSKNLMIQAEKGGKPGGAGVVGEYMALKDFWSVSPFIEQLLGEEIQRLLQPAASP